MAAAKEKITPTRLEAFSDGVIAIIITIMVLELKVPHQDTLAGLAAQWPIFISYALSFLLVAEYWMNHHMLFHLIRHVGDRLLWSNLLVLFCISLIPFFTGFMGENHISAFSVAAYSAWAMVCAISFMVLLTAVFRHVDMKEEDKRCLRQAALLKCCIAIVLYGLAVVAAPYSPMTALALNFVVAIMYFLPNTWLEKREA
ncbi:MAG: TMEM175 family protein [Alphaproteobacteria bacterium]